MIGPKKCLECGITLNLDRASLRKRTTCSMSCRRSLNKKHTQAIDGKGTDGVCVECQSTFVRRIRRQACCSLSCASKKRSRERVRSSYFRVHGENRKTIEHSTWQAMIERCSNPNHPRFHRYGGRGIEVCDRWKKYENFLYDMGRRPSSGYSLDRIDNDGNYEPTNCRWATSSQQYANMSKVRTCGNCRMPGHNRITCDAS